MPKETTQQNTITGKSFFRRAIDACCYKSKNNSLSITLSQQQNATLGDIPQNETLNIESTLTTSETKNNFSTNNSIESIAKIDDHDLMFIERYTNNCISPTTQQKTLSIKKMEKFLEKYEKNNEKLNTLPQDTITEATIIKLHKAQSKGAANY